ncbi:MAG: FMN-binding protein [bacterium]|nr:FMN-binding protein [bacterium]
MRSKLALLCVGAFMCACCADLGFSQPGASAVICPNPASAQKVFLTQKEALALAFPKCEIQRTTAFLSKEQVKSIAKAAKVSFKSSIVYPYIATKKGKLVGTAYFDTHLVRTLKETVMVVVDPQGKVRRIEVLAFGEPKQYIPSKKWYQQIVGLKLSPKLKLNFKVRNMTGATLTARAAVDCSRRILALHAELNKPAPKPKENPE